MSDSKIFYHVKYYRYEYHGKKTMGLKEAEEGMKWFRSHLSTNFKGQVVGKIRKYREANGSHSLWYRDRTYKE